MNRSAARFDWTWTGSLVILGLVSRLPFTTQILYHWDAVNFTLALEKYDISLHQPQPPGYLLYVLLGRLAYWLAGDANRALTGISILSSILATVLLYFLGKEMFNRRVGAAASLLLLLSPLIWFYSQIAKPNIIDAPMVTLCALLLWRFMRGQRGALVGAALALGIAGGFRQQTLVFLAPLAVYAFRKEPFRRMFAGAALTGLTFLASFVPMVLLAGGVEQYRAAMAGLSSTFFTHTSILMGGGVRGLLSNVSKWVAFTLYALLLALVPLGGWLLVRLRSAKAAWKDERAWFLAMWMLPSLLFYTLIHMGSHGLIFTYLPAVILIAALGLVELVDHAARRPRAALSGALLVICAANVLVFAVAPDRPFGADGINIVNRATLAENDRFYAARFALIRARFDPQATLILTSQWRHAQVYLPEYTVLSSPCSAGSETGGLDGLYRVYGGRYEEVDAMAVEALLTEQIRSVILFDGPQGCFYPDAWQNRIETVSTQGETLQFIRIAEPERLSYTDGGLKIIP